MSNYWIRDNGQNTLKGIEGDADNPAVLPDILILDLLSEGNQKAREDFLTIVPTLSQEEQDRLNNLYAFSTPPRAYPQDREDQFQSSMNSLIVRTGGGALPNQKTNTSSNNTSKLKVRI